ncbi:hypothetical protein EBF04_16100 [Streptomyces sp. I6]|nr:hypothetical protein EBF04_16100 [Streptomyces sp. I6]
MGRGVRDAVSGTRAVRTGLRDATPEPRTEAAPPGRQIRGGVGIVPRRRRSEAPGPRDPGTPGSGIPG